MAQRGIGFSMMRRQRLLMSLFTLLVALPEVYSGPPPRGPPKGALRRPDRGPMKFTPGTPERLLIFVETALREPTPAQQELLKDAETTAEKIIRLIDDFCWNQHWMMLVGDVKGAIVDDALMQALKTFKQRKREKVPGQMPGEGFVGIELGTYIGYSAIRLAKLLPDGAKLYSCDPDPRIEVVARQMLDRAEIGSGTKVEFMPMPAQAAIAQLKSEGVPKFDFVFIDHKKDDYLADLQYLVAMKMLKRDAVIVADNVDYFSINDYLDFVRNNPHFGSSHHKSTLEYAPYKPDGTPQIADGVEVTYYTPPPTKGPRRLDSEL